MKKNEIPVLLLTGYLGSGKTTLVNHILSNERGIRFAVIVNDIGEVNIDAALIQKGGIVGKKDDSLVALQNGCICCTLKMDLVEQLNDILKMGRFDYIVIEASGICEPEPIAQTICSIPRMGGEYVRYGTAYLDCIVTVVDALRLQSEFTCGDDLTRDDIGEEDIASLLIQQIEFCNIILLNKASEVSPQELERIKQIIRALQPTARIITCDYARVDLDDIIHTGSFRFGQVATSAGWIKEIEREMTEDEQREAKYGRDNGHLADDDDDDDDDEHGHHHHHDDDDDDEHGHHHHDDDDDDDDHEGHHHDDDDEHHHHDDDDDDDHESGHHHHHHHHHHHEGEGEAEEYGIETFVYYRRPAFDIHRFDHFACVEWPRNIIRAKGVCYFAHNREMSYLFEQAGVQKKLTETGLWYATAPEEELMQVMREQPDLLRDWDEEYGDRMQKIVFIGQHLDREALVRSLDACLER